MGQDEKYTVILDYLKTLNNNITEVKKEVNLFKIQSGENNQEVKNDIHNIKNNLNNLNRVVFKDPLTNEFGLIDKSQAAEVYQQQYLEELSALKDNDKKREEEIRLVREEITNNLAPTVNKMSEILANFVIRFDNLGSIPKKSLIFVIRLSALIGSIMVIVSFWEKIKIAFKF